MPRSNRRVRRREVRSSSRSRTPERPARRRRVSSSPPTSPRPRRAATPPATVPPAETTRAAATLATTAIATSTPADDSRQPANSHPTTQSTVNTINFQAAVAAEVARISGQGQGRVTASTVRGGGRGRARGWGRGRWVNFGFYLPHPGPYTPFCRAHREPGCAICMTFCPTSAYMDPADNNFSTSF